MSPGRIVAAVTAALVALAAVLGRRRGKLTGERLIAAVVAIAALAVYASGVLSGFNVEHAVTKLAHALGAWTYALVGAMAFAETGAFLGFVAPGEFTVILGGVIAAEGEIDITLLLPLVWICCFLGDTTSFFLGRRLGRSFLLRHGERIKITPERFAQVEAFFDRRGGATILVGRFIGLVRPIAPFIAGSSRMTYRRFVPYSILGTGLWATTFCLLGYVFYRSFSKVASVAGKATLVFGVFVAVIVGAVYAYRRLRDEEERRRLAAWLERQAERPALRPVGAVVRPAWRRVVRPVARALAPHGRFVLKRLTPGGLGIELTTALAVAVVGFYVFALYTVVVSGDPGPTAADRFFRDLASDTRIAGVVDVVKPFTALASLPVAGGLALAGSLALAWRRRRAELAALLGGFALVWVGVMLAKAGIDRPRPPHPLVGTHGAAFPSGHAAYSVVYVALAVLGWRLLPGLASKAAIVLFAALLSAALGLSRIYLGAHWWSDVAGGWGLACGIFGTAAAALLVSQHLRNTR
ncbi:MAG: bifunctional DedA family/phosphatase PAP2 family protein [Thermoleophilaceae bacterium]|nr:bifunctional DedA family/phosphatase PAP2 family protein [Thermoleophilaceae bacterium]